MINQNELARKIAALEAGKSEVGIAQIKEILKHALNLLADERPSQVLALLEKRL